MLGNNNFKLINNLSLSITKFGFIPKFIIGTVFAIILLFRSNIEALKFSFFCKISLALLFLKPKTITFAENMKDITKKQKKMNATLSKEIFISN